MAEYNSLKELFTDICDSLRAKTGTTDPIKHAEIAEKIDNIETGPAEIKHDSTFMSAGFKYGRPISELSLEMTEYITEHPDDMYDISFFYRDCGSLIDVTDVVLDFSNAKIYNMIYMFYGCNNLTSLSLSNIDTSNVFSMAYMFYNCSKMKTLDISSFDTSKVLDMSYMFSQAGPTALNLENFNTSEVVDMRSMFYYCGNLASLNVTSFNTGKVKNMSGMFMHCAAMSSFDVSAFDTSKVTDMSNMFQHCRGMTSLDISNFDTSSATNLSGIFNYCMSLQSLKIGGMLDNNTGIATISMFDTNTNQNIKLDFDGHSFSSRDSEAILNLATIWRGTDDTKIASYEAFANSLGQNTSGYTRTVKIYTNLYNALTADQKALVTGKGYTLSYGTS